MGELRLCLLIITVDSEQRTDAVLLFFKFECGIYLLFNQVFQCSVRVNLWISEKQTESYRFGLKLL